MTGRPKVTALKKMEKNKVYGVDGEPEPRKVAPGKPPHLSKRAEKVWERLEGMLVDVGLLAETHGEMFASLCNIVAKLEVLQEHQSDEGFAPVVVYSIMDSAGNEKPQMKINPILVEERLLHAQLRMYASEFGLSPRGQAGLVVGTGDDKGESMVD